MTYKIEMEFASPNELAFKDAYLGWTDLAYFHTVLLGMQKRPYGLDHLNSSRYNVFMERPFIIEAINQDARRFGLCSYGVSDNEAWNWRYGVFNLQDVQRVGAYKADAYQLELAGRLANTIWYDETSDGRGYAHWAVAGTIADPTSSLGAGDPDDPSVGFNQGRFRTRPEARTDERWLDTGRIAGAETYELVGLEGVLNLGPLQIVGEYQRVLLQRSTGPDLEFDGGYVYVSYFLTGEHTPWERESGTLGRTKPFENFFLVERCCGGAGGGWGAWQIAARYSHADFTDDNILGGIGDSVTLGLNWWWTQYGRMQFNYIHGSIKEHAPVAGFTSGDYDAFGARFMVDF
jgi:phosphate-selective porin OprO/OprP